MSSYLKPQNPLYHKAEDAYFYPLTTADQILMEDGSRLNAEISKHLFVDTLNANEAEPNGINADTLGGYTADEYARKEDLENIDTGISVDLLWENANLLDEFVEQEITLNLNDYYKIEIVYDYCPDMSQYYNGYFILLSTSYLGTDRDFVSAYAEEQGYSRTAEYFYSTNSLKFYDTYTDNEEAAASSNYLIVPYRIYGYKGGNV